MRSVETPRGCSHDCCALLDAPCRNRAATPPRRMRHDMPLPTWSHRAGFCFIPPYEAPPLV